MKLSKKLLLLCTSLLIVAGMTGMLVGCGGGSSSNSPSNNQTGNLELSKSTYNFGNVTLGNAATLSVIISNTGTKDLSITQLTLSDNSNFAIDPSGPCTVAAGLNCTFNITFSPTVEGSYSETLNIASDDADTPTATVTLTGEGKTISTYSVVLNQVETDCSKGTVTAYISVTDQEGFAVTGFTVDDFTISEDGGAPIVPASVDYADTTSFPLSVAVLMDYSGSAYNVPNLIEVIEDSVSSFVGALGAADKAEIIKFASSVQTTQAFTTDQTLLDSAIYEVPVGIGNETVLYDALYQGIEDAAAQTTRRAVLALTDGRDSDPGSTHTLNDVINLGKDLGVPVFTVGVGKNVYIDDLTQIAAETGGQFFDSPDMDRLQTIYSQLSEILNNQYILTYTSAGTGADVNTVVSLQHGTGTIYDSNALTYSSCP
jgi:VWFA-related protein